jgi:hypothetical protein
MKGNYIKKTAAEAPPAEATGWEAVYLDSLPNLVLRQLGLGAIIQLPGSENVDFMTGSLQVFRKVSEQERSG